MLPLQSTSKMTIESPQSSEAPALFSTQTVAQDALEKLLPLTDSADSQITADLYLKAIEENGNHKEQILAKVARQNLNAESIATARETFRALSSPVTVAIGPALAQIGMKLYADFQTVPATTAAFLQGIVEHGSQDEKAFAQIAHQACTDVRWPNAARIQHEALQRISQGLTLPIREELVKFGHRAIQIAWNQGAGGQGEVGRAYLATFEKFGNSSEQQFVSEMTRAMDEGGVVYARLADTVFRTACNPINGSVGLAIARFGSEVPKQWPATSSLCRALLGSVERSIDNKEDAFVARTALKVTDGIEDLTSQKDHLTTEIIAKATFDEIQAGNHPIDGKLARLGEVMTSEFVHLSDPQNTRATIVLQTIAEHAQLPANQVIARNALKSTEGKAPFFFPSKKYSKDLDILQQAFEDIRANATASSVEANMKTAP